MLSPVLHAFWTPFRYILDIIVIFGPITLFAILFGFGLVEFIKHVEEVKKHGELSPFYDLIFPAILLVAVICLISLVIGMVKWTRKIILDEPAQPTNLIPRNRDWRYAKTLLAYGFVFMCAYLAPASYLVFPLTSDENANGIKPVLTLAENLHITQQLFLALLITHIFLSAIWGRFLLNLPASATNENLASVVQGLAREQKIRITIQLMLTGTILLAIMYAIFHTQLIYLNKETWKTWIAPTIITISSIVASYCWLVIPTLFALFYKSEIHTDETFFRPFHV